MRLPVLLRRVHYVTSIAIAVPLLVIACSGLLLQVKKHWSWVQPVEQRGTGTEPAIDLEELLASVRSVEALAVTGWEDVRRVDLRPGRGVAKVWLANGWEVQVDLGTGRALQAAFRRSDLIESIHDGSFFGGEIGRLGVFLPSGGGLLVLLGTGLWLFFYPLWLRRRRRREREVPRFDGSGGRR